MKFSTIAATLLASAAAAAPTAASSLPAKFSLSFSAPDISALSSLSHDIVYDPAGGFKLYLGKSGTLIPAIFTASGTTAAISRQFLALKNQPSGSAVFLSSASDAAEGGYTTAGLGVAEGGALTWDFADGRGALQMWSACVIQGVWGLNWAVGSQAGRTCYGVKVVARAV